MPAERAPMRKVREVLRLRYALGVSERQIAITTGVSRSTVSEYLRRALRRTKATLIYRRTGNLRAVQLLLGHTKIESTVRYLGIEVDDALATAEQTDV